MASELPEVFVPRDKFQDDVWGQIKVNDLERDVIDTPEFQRLFRTSQLGFVDLVYQTANHTRGAHSIGACHVANLLMDHLDENCKGSSELPLPISPGERVLIRLGALLHDISHVPLSHDIERKNHKIGDSIKVPSHYGHYEKHDDYRNNPLLHRLLCEPEISVLARVLRSYSEPFYRLLCQSDAGEKPHSPHLKQFLQILFQNREQWNPEEKLLPALLFHLLFHEDPEKGDESRPTIARDYGATPFPWGLGPLDDPGVQRELHNLWYQPFRHDIIGNTLSADLIDYLKRDCQRLGMDRHIDLHLLNYYILVPWHFGQRTKADTPARPQWYRCAINLRDKKRNTSRIILVNDIFRLLDLRHEIHEKAVMHRVVQSANAMLSRALLLLDKKKPRLQDLVGLGGLTHALQGEDYFFRVLFDIGAANRNDSANQPRVREAHRIIRKLIERRVYRPLLIIPGDRAAERSSDFHKGGNAGEDCPEMNRTEYKLRTLATIVDSPYYSRFLLFVSASIERYLQGLFNTREELRNHVLSVIDDGDLVRKAMAVVPSRVVIWTTPYKQLYKDPALVVALQGWVGQIDELKHGAENGAEGDPWLTGLVEASIAAADSKYATLWKLYVFISDGLFYSGVINKLLGLSGGAVAWKWHKERLRDCQASLVRAIDTLGDDWSSYCRDHKGQDVTKKEQLNMQMDGGQFRNIVRKWIESFTDTQDATREELCKFCGIDIEHYVHDWDASRTGVYSKCRDIPYKFDGSSEATLRRARGKLAGDSERDLLMFLEGPLGVDPKVLTEREFHDLADSFDEEARNRLRDMGEESIDKDKATFFLKELFWGDYPRPLALAGQHKAGTRDTVSESPTPIGGRGKPTAGAPPTPYGDIPTTRRGITHWLSEEAHVLDPHVRRDFNGNIRAIVDFVMEEVSEQERPAVLLDIRERLDNESRTIFNNIREDGVVAVLRRKWRNY